MRATEDGLGRQEKWFLKLQRRKRNRKCIHDWEVGAVTNACKSPHIEKKEDTETRKGISPEQ